MRVTGNIHFIGLFALISSKPIFRASASEHILRSAPTLPLDNLEVPVGIGRLGIFSNTGNIDIEGVDAKLHAPQHNSVLEKKTPYFDQ